MLAPKLIPSSNVSMDFTASIFRVFKKSRIPKEGNYHDYCENIQSLTALRIISLKIHCKPVRIISLRIDGSLVRIVIPRRDGIRGKFVRVIGPRNHGKSLRIIILNDLELMGENWCHFWIQQVKYTLKRV
jgi:hypothetical protein